MSKADKKENPAESRNVLVKALKAKEGKPQHMEVGKVYPVGKQLAEELVKAKKAEYIKSE